MNDRRQIGVSWALLLMIIAPAVVDAAEWRGLVPLRSTRGDVQEKLKRKSSGQGVDTFVIDGDKVTIAYSVNGCSDGFREIDVPKDVVTSIVVRPDTPPPLTKLGLDLSRFRITGTDTSITYEDRERGLSLDVADRDVYRLIYEGTSQDRLKFPPCKETQGNASFETATCPDLGISHDPSGSFFLTSGFSRILRLDHVVLRARVVEGKLRVDGVVRTLNKFEFVIEDAKLKFGVLDFVTIPIDGVQYRFAGEFSRLGVLHNLNETSGLEVLEGTLERIELGKKTLSIPHLQFTYRPRCLKN